MKKLFVVLAIVIAFSLVLVGCSSKQENKAIEETTEIIAAENSVNGNTESETEFLEEKDVPAETEAQQTIEETENTNETEPETTIDKKDTTSDIESEKQTAMEQPVEEISSDKESSTGSGQKYIIFTADGMNYEFDKKIDVNWAINTYGKSNILWIDNGDEVVQIADNGEVGTTKKNNTEVVDGVKWNHNYDAYVPYYQGEKEGYTFVPGIVDYIKNPEPVEPYQVDESVCLKNQLPDIPIPADYDSDLNWKINYPVKPDYMNTGWDWYYDTTNGKIFYVLDGSRVETVDTVHLPDGRVIPFDCEHRWGLGKSYKSQFGLIEASQWLAACEDPEMSKIIDAWMNSYK